MLRTADSLSPGVHGSGGWLQPLSGFSLLQCYEKRLFIRWVALSTFQSISNNWADTQNYLLRRSRQNPNPREVAQLISNSSKLQKNPSRSDHSLSKELCHEIRKVQLSPNPGGRGLPYMGYIGTCRCEGYGFQAVYSGIG